MQTLYQDAASAQLIESLRREVESLKSTVEFLSAIHERSTEASASHGDQLTRVEDTQRMLIEKLREVCEHQQSMHAWLMQGIAAPVQQPALVMQPLAQVPAVEHIPATLPDIESQAAQ